MRKILCLPLPVLLALACGDNSDSRPESADAAPDVGKADTVPSSPDVPAKLDLFTPDASLDLPATPIDVAPTVDHQASGLDAPEATLDAPESQDGPTIIVEWDVPPAQKLDGPPGPIDATTRTLFSPDGRTWTVIMVNACQLGSQPDTTRCPATYGEGLAKVRAVDGGSSFSETRAGRCSEGSYVYFPYFGTSSIGCYYDASEQRLVASAQHEDTIIECGQDGTASNTLARGAYPPCTKIIWEATTHL